MGRALNGARFDDREKRMLSDRWGARSLVMRLRRIAGRVTRGDTSSSYESMDLVQDTLFHLARHKRMPCRDDPHRLALARRFMRLLFLEHLRERRARKRCPPGAMVPLPEGGGVAEGPGGSDRLVLRMEVDRLLQELALHHGRAAQVVRLHHYEGLTMDEVAARLEVSRRTVLNDWSFARAWLHERLSRDRRRPA